MFSWHWLIQANDIIMYKASREGDTDLPSEYKFSSFCFISSSILSLFSFWSSCVSPWSSFSPSSSCRCPSSSSSASSRSELLRKSKLSRAVSTSWLKLAEVGKGTWGESRGVLGQEASRGHAGFSFCSPSEPPLVVLTPGQTDTPCFVPPDVPLQPQLGSLLFLLQSADCPPTAPHTARPVCLQPTRRPPPPTALERQSQGRRFQRRPLIGQTSRRSRRSPRCSLRHPGWESRTSAGGRWAPILPEWKHLLPPSRRPPGWTRATASTRWSCAVPATAERWAQTAARWRPSASGEPAPGWRSRPMTQRSWTKLFRSPFPPDASAGTAEEVKMYSGMSNQRVSYKNCKESSNWWNKFTRWKITWCEAEFNGSVS